MKKQKLIGAAAFAAALALALGGCAAGTDGGGSDGGTGGGDVEQADYNPQPREALEQGGTVNFPIAEVPEQLNPFNSDGSANTAQLWSWYNPQLLLMEPDGTPYKNDAYLDVWEHEVVDGNTQLTFTFTEEAHWNDGTDMDWTAIETTWQANKSSDDGYNQSSTDGYSKIASVEQGDTAKTAIVTFDGEFAWPESIFGFILNPAVDSPDVYNTAYVNEPNSDWGAGPYMIDEFDSNNQFVSFVPNPEWWGNEPMLDEVTFTGLDATASINAFKNGEIDMVGVGTKDRLQQVSDMEGITIYRALQTANTILEVDAEKPQFAELEVRHAFFNAINIDNQKAIAWDGLDYSEDPAGSLILFSFQENYTDSYANAGLKYDPEGAAKMLEDAGWIAGADGIREKDGVRLSVTYPIFSDDPVQSALAQSIQAAEKEIGFEVIIDQRPPADFSSDYSSKNWDAMGLRFTSSDPFGAAYFCQMWCSDSGLNLSATGTPEIDAQIKADIESISDPIEQTKAAMAMEEEIIAKTWGVIPLYNGPSISAVKDGLANLTPEPYTGLDLFGVQPVENTGWMK